MKYMEKLYYMSKTEAFEVQDIYDNVKIELHYLDDEPFCNELINKGSFSSWSTPDGKNYKLFIEKNFYDAAPDFYQKSVNQIWVDFWNKYTSLNKKYIFLFTLPLFAVLIAAILLTCKFLPNMSWLIIAEMGVALIASLVVKALFSRALQKGNAEAVAKIKECVGAEAFDKGINDQNEYIRKYFEDLQAKYEEEDRLAEEQEKENSNSDAEAKEETNEVENANEEATEELSQEENNEDNDKEE